MADIFISYSRLDRERVKPLAERLSSLGYSVWWTGAERARQAPVDERERALHEARAVLVVWSGNGRDTIEVQADAACALDAGKLLQVKLEPVAPPPPFNAVAAADMAGGGEWGPLEHALARLIKGEERSASQPRTNLGPAPVLAASGAPTLVTIAIAAVLAAFAGALSAGWNGVMTPDQLRIALFGVLGVATLCAGMTAFRLFTILRAAA